MSDIVSLLPFDALYILYGIIFWKPLYHTQTILRIPCLLKIFLSNKVLLMEAGLLGDSGPVIEVIWDTATISFQHALLPERA